MTEQELKARKELRQIYAQTFNTEAGLKVLEDLKGRCYCNTTTFSSKRGETDNREGMRSVILTIESMMTLKLEDDV